MTSKTTPKRVKKWPLKTLKKRQKTSFLGVPKTPQKRPFLGVPEQPGFWGTLKTSMVLVYFLKKGSRGPPKRGQKYPKIGSGPQKGVFFDPFFDHLYNGFLRISGSKKWSKTPQKHDFWRFFIIIENWVLPFFAVKTTIFGQKNVKKGVKKRVFWRFFEFWGSKMPFFFSVCIGLRGQKRVQKGVKKSS